MALERQREGTWYRVFVPTDTPRLLIESALIQRAESVIGRSELVIEALEDPDRGAQEDMGRSLERFLAFLIREAWRARVS